MVARYGGEEFIVILQNIDYEGAENVAENLLKAVRDLGIKHEYSSAADHVTISLGIAFKPAEEKVCTEELLKTADDALYRAKEEGRNRFVAL